MLDFALQIPYSACMIIIKNKALLITSVGLLLIGLIAYILLNDTSVPEQSMLTPTPTKVVDTYETNDITDTSSNRYIEYSPEVFTQMNDKKRIYFFHASWCPTCKVANIDFEENEDQIPEDVIVFKTDYDTETELKNRYGITYQHTFVYVDENGNELAKWNGGGVNQLRAELQ